MAVGGIVDTGNRGNYEGRVTPFVIITCIVGASGGLIFGYDIGISGMREIFIRDKCLCNRLFSVCEHNFWLLHDILQVEAIIRAHGFLKVLANTPRLCMFYHVMDE